MKVELRSVKYAKWATAIASLLDDYLLRKDFKRDLAKSVLYEGTDGKMYAVTPRRKGTDLRAAATVVGQRSDCRRVLNTLSEAEAFAIYQKAVGG